MDFEIVKLIQRIFFHGIRNYYVQVNISVSQFVCETPKPEILLNEIGIIPFEDELKTRLERLNEILIRFDRTK